MRTKKLEIDPANMIRDREGQITTTWFVRLPQGMITDDTKDPAIWKAAQQSRGKVMRRHDEVYAVGYDEDFAIIARVVDATRDAAVLGITKIVTFPERITPAFNDGTYRVRWAGTGYQVERIKDGARMGPVHGSEALAIRHVQALYPTPVG